MSGGNGLGTLLDDIEGGARLAPPEALRLLEARGEDVWRIAATADLVRRQRVGDVVTFVRNQNINVTNICVNKCGFCGFSRKPGDPDGYLFGREDVVARARQAAERNVSEICTVSGLHPDFTGDSYIQIYEWIREGAPGVHIHAGNPMEVAYGARKSGISTREQLQRMKDAGVGSICGTAAEILVDDVRKVICPQKVSTAEWERIIREAHEMGIPSTATIMYGCCDTPGDRIAHLSLIREIQDDTGGFTEFVPLPYVHMQTPLYLAGRAEAGATGREDILLHAVCRLFLDNIDHIQVSWVKLGLKFAHLCLLAGADDLGGTMYEERITKGAGAANTDFIDPAEMGRLASDLGRTLVERDTLYRPVKR
ncbi:MAG: 5-amino-6-(D-ribitylamino)uracil--L-tyrosine 4-hydroxyphenyl transferase CofH [Methanoculleaceae archaeon]